MSAHIKLVLTVLLFAVVCECAPVNKIITYTSGGNVHYIQKIDHIDGTPVQTQPKIYLNCKTYRRKQSAEVKKNSEAETVVPDKQRPIVQTELKTSTVEPCVRTAEIIKVPNRVREDCPEDKKMDMSGKCRQDWG